MRITLVHPSGFNFIPGQPDFSVLANRLAPVGILSLAAWLEQHGHPTAVYDCLGPLSPPSLEAQAAEILPTPLAWGPRCWSISRSWTPCAWGRAKAPFWTWPRAGLSRRSRTWSGATLIAS